MNYSAKAKYVRYSSFKLRPIADVVRGKNAQFALDWLDTYRTQRAVAIRKAVQSAVANAKDVAGLESRDLIVNDIRIDQGPTFKYFKPGAMGRANPQRKRLCHISVTVQSIKKEA